MSKNLKKILITGASLLMMASIGAGISNVSVNASSNVSGDISQQVLNQSIAETKAGDQQTERAEIESGIHMDKQYPKLAAYDALTEPNIFNKYIKPAISNYTNSQKKEFNDEYYADSGEYYFKGLNNNHKKSAVHHIRRHAKNMSRNKRVRKPRRKVTKHVKRTKKHAIKRHRAKRTKKVARKHTTHKANNYNYLGTYKQGSNQARNDYKSQRLSGLSKKSLFNHLIRNKKLKSSKYLDGYDNKFINMGNIDEDSDFADEVTQMASFAQEYLRDNYPTRSAISNYFTHAKPSRYLRHNRQYKKEFSYLYNNY